MTRYRLSDAMIVLILYINLLNLSWMIKCLFLMNMEPLRNHLHLRSHKGKISVNLPI